jgi:hypothetical protein
VEDIQAIPWDKLEPQAQHFLEGTGLLAAKLVVFGFGC